MRMKDWWLDTEAENCSA